MSESKMNYSINEVMEVRFRPAFRGYNQDDVDVFLDHIVQDYMAFNKEIDRLNKEIENLKKGYRR